MSALKEHFYESVRHLIENARSKVWQTVNTTLVVTYWEIGKKSSKRSSMVKNGQNMVKPC